MREPFSKLKLRIAIQPTWASESLIGSLRKFLLFPVGFSLSVACAQSTNASVAPGNFVAAIHDVEDPSSVLRSEYLKNVFYEGDGFYARRQTREFAFVIDDILDSSRRQRQFTDQGTDKDCLLSTESNPIAKLVEKRFRITYVFKDGPHRTMLTVTDVVKAKESLRFPLYLAKGVEGVGNVVTVLGVPKDSPNQRAIWVSTWHRSGFFYELYSETRFVSTTETPPEIRPLHEVMRTLRCTWTN